MLETPRASVQTSVCLSDIGSLGERDCSLGSDYPNFTSWLPKRAGKLLEKLTCVITSCSWCAKCGYSSLANCTCSSFTSWSPPGLSPDPPGGSRLSRKNNPGEKSCRRTRVLGIAGGPSGHPASRLQQGRASNLKPS